MTSFYILLACASIAIVVLYFSLQGILKILDQIKSSIIGICLVMFLTASIYLVINRQNADQILEEIQIWKVETSAGGD